VRIGRHSDCDIFIDDAVVSTEHAVIETIENPDSKGSPEFYIIDQDSTNGTFLRILYHRSGQHQRNIFKRRKDDPAKIKP